MKAMGKHKWVIPGGDIPARSTGKEPEMLSQDAVAILNTQPKDITIRITVYYENQKAMPGYTLEVKGERLRKIRINDLIDPLPVPLETPYSLVIESSQRIIVQFTRMNTSQAPCALMGTMAFGTR